MSRVKSKRFLFFLYFLIFEGVDLMSSSTEGVDDKPLFYTEVATTEEILEITSRNDAFVHYYVDKTTFYKCIPETDVNPALVLGLINGYRWNTPYYSLQKWVLCVLEKNEIMSSTGKLLFSKALAMVPPELRKDVEIKMKQCEYPYENMLPHEKAWHYITCYNAVNPKHFNIL